MPSPSKPQKRHLLFKRHTFAGEAVDRVALIAPAQRDAAEQHDIFAEAQMIFDRAVLPVVQAYCARGDMRVDILGHMMQVEHEGKRFTDEEITAFIRMLLLAAGETTTRSIANMVVQLLENPDVLEEVRADRTLVRKAVMETMRRDPTAGAVARIAAKDMEINGTRVAKETAVLLSLAAADRDPETYEDPDRLWLMRPMRPLLSFGFGPHMCMGMHMALAEMEVALDALLDLPNLRFDPAYPHPEIRGLNMRGTESRTAPHLQIVP